MTDFVTLISEIASQIDGVILSQESGPDLRSIALANEREGLRVICRRGYGAESSRVRFTMSLQALKGPADFRELPAVHELETAAAMSRGARVIAAQIETKIIQPAIPMRDAWINRLGIKAQERAAFLNSFARYQAALPGARFTLAGENSNSASVHISRVDGGYITARINSDGGFYVDRMSSVPEAKGLAMVALFLESDQ